MRKPKSRILIFYIDRLLDELAESESAEIRHLFGSYKCLILSSRRSEWKGIFPEASTEEYRFDMPNPLFLQTLLSGYSCRIEDLMFISDDPSFLLNSIGAFVKTIYIGRFEDLDYGKLPDIVLPSLKMLTAHIESGDKLLGEGIASLMQTKSLPGIIGTTEIRLPEHNEIMPVVFSGRYYGTDHFLGRLDFLSYSIRINKNANSSLHGRFNGIFARILLAEMNKALKIGVIDSICGVPDHQNDPESYKFDEIITDVANKKSLFSIQSHVRCVKDYKSQKSQSSKQDRLVNIKGAFDCDMDLTGRRILLFDDLMTTGATIAECASMLMSKGAEYVIGAVLAVNQFPVESWYEPERIDYCDSYSFRANSKTLEPFFARSNGGTVKYGEVINGLLDRMNEAALKKKLVPSAFSSSDDIPF